MRLLCFVTLVVLVASLVGTAFARIDDIGFATPTTDEYASGDMSRIDDIGFSVIRDVITPVVIVFVVGAL